MSLVLSISPSSGKFGDLVTITNSDLSSEFIYPQYNKNIVTFNGNNDPIIAKIISGTTTQLRVVVPADAITGDVTVQTFDQTANVLFYVLYEDEKFDSIPEFFSKGTINDKIKTVGTGQYSTPLYNKDISYGNFVEVYDENSLLQNVYTIVLTQRGERMFSNFGIDINKLIFTTYVSEEEMKNKILEEVSIGIETYEPRVTLIKETSVIIVEDETINLLLSLRMPRGNVKELGITLGNVNNITN